MVFYKKITFFIIFLSLFNVVTAFSQNKLQVEQKHEITLYLMPTLYPINWDNPAGLYKSMRSCYIKTIFKRNHYLLGHLAVRIVSPLLKDTLYMAMRSTDSQDKIDYVLKERIGFAILGAGMKGRLETKNEIKQQLKIYSERNLLAFMSYQVNEQAIKRMLEFIDRFSHPQHSMPAQSKFYSGVYWPRYFNEGAGCTAFGLALLDVANILPPESDSWLQKVFIPMEIIGGQYNQNKKIRSKTIYRTTSWADSTGKENVDFVKFQIYDPNLIYNWILKTRNDSLDTFVPIERKGLPGLYMDVVDVSVKSDEPLFMPRPDENFFIKIENSKLSAKKINSD